MDEEEDSDSIVPADQGFNCDPSLVDTGCEAPGPCRPPMNHYFMWNSGDLSQLIPSHGDKRKKVLVTMEEKLRALQRLDAGESVKTISEELGVGKSTVSDWKKHRIEIERWYANQAGGSCIKARKTMRKGKHAQVEKALYHWYEYLRSKGFQAGGPLLQKKALLLKEKIEGEEGERFTASEGWLDRWKKRFGIGPLLNSSIDLTSEGENLVEELKKELFEIDNIKGEQLYCCGRVLLNYRMIPTNILGYKGCVNAEREINEETFYVLPCSNATGNHKLRLTIIGKSEKFQALETIKDNELLPFWYCQQNEVWLDSSVLKAWFESEFVPAVEKNLILHQLPRKAVLLVTNYPSFVNLNELQNGDIRVIFIPVQAAPICQPMDQGVIESLKKKYWCRLLSSVITTSTDRENCLKTLKSVDIIEAIQFTSEAWEEIPSSTLALSWKHLINQREDLEWAESENQELNKTIDDKELIISLKKLSGSDDVNIQDVNEWLANEEDDEIVSDDIVAMVLREPPPDLDPTEESSINDEETITEPIVIKTELPDGDLCAENIPPQVKRIRHSDGFKAITKVLEYVSQQEEATPEDIVWFLKWRDIAAQKSSLEEKHRKSVKRPKLL